MSERTVIQSISQGQVLTTLPQASAYEAAGSMSLAHCGSIIVIDASGSMVGILTERDLMTKVVAKALDPAKTSVSDIMTRNPRFVSPDTSIVDAVLIMQDGGFRHLPILSSTREVIGVFSIRDAAPRELSKADQHLERIGNSVGY